MIERQRMQELVVGAHPAVDDAAHVLPHHRFMGQHRALRQRFRAAGVDDLREIAAVDGGLEEGAVGVQKIVEGGDARGRRSPDLRPAARSASRPRSPWPLRPVPPRRSRDPSPAASRRNSSRMKLISSGLSMKLIGTSTAPIRAERKAQGGKGVRIAREHRDAIALADAEPEQTAAEPIADRVHLGKGPAHVAADHGQLVRIALRGAAQEIADRVLPRFRDGQAAISPVISPPVTVYCIYWIAWPKSSGFDRRLSAPNGLRVLHVHVLDRPIERGDLLEAAPPVLQDAGRMQTTPASLSRSLRRPLGEWPLRARSGHPSVYRSHDRMLRSTETFNLPSSVGYVAPFLVSYSDAGLFGTTGKTFEHAQPRTAPTNHSGRCIG